MEYIFEVENSAQGQRLAISNSSESDDSNRQYKPLRPVVQESRGRSLEVLTPPGGGGGGGQIHRLGGWTSWVLWVWGERRTGPSLLVMQLASLTEQG